MSLSKHTRHYMEHGLIAGCITLLWAFCMKDDPWAAVGIVAIFFVYSCLLGFHIGRDQFRRAEERKTHPNGHISSLLDYSE